MRTLDYGNFMLREDLLHGNKQKETNFQKAQLIKTLLSNRRNFILVFAVLSGLYAANE